MFGSTKRKREQEAAAVAARQRAEVERAKRRAQDAQEDAWRSDRNAAIKILHAAEDAYAKARQAHSRYAPGPQKDAAARALNAAAVLLGAAEQAFKAVDDLRSWSRGRR